MTCPFVRLAGLDIGKGFLGVGRIVDDDDIRAESGGDTTDRCRLADSALRRFEICGWLPRVFETCPRENPSIPCGVHHLPALSAEGVGQGLPVARAHDLERWIMTEAPGDISDRYEDRLEA